MKQPDISNAEMAFCKACDLPCQPILVESWESECCSVSLTDAAGSEWIAEPWEDGYVSI